MRKNLLANDSPSLCSLWNENNFFVQLFVHVFNLMSYNCEYLALLMLAQHLQFSTHFHFILH